MNDFVVDGIHYRSKKLAARTQAHVARRLVPILDPVFRLLQREGDSDEAISAFAQGFATLSDENLDYVMDHCLSVVQRKQGEAWANYMAQDGKSVMFQDIDLSSEVQIIAFVLRDNFQAVAQSLAKTFAGFAPGGDGK